MTWLFNHSGWVVTAIVFVFMVLAGTAVLEAWMDTRKRPRESMYWCHIHGLIRKKHCLILFPEMKKANGENFLVCPMCYKDSVYDRVDERAKVNG